MSFESIHYLIIFHEALMNIVNNSSEYDYLVSVICTSYNQIDYLTETIKSILHQSYDNIELIIVDDASTLDQFDKFSISEFIDSNNLKNINYKIIINKENQGHSEAINIGVSQSNGDYFLYINGDDYLDENSVKLMVHEQKLYDLDLCFGCLRELHTNGEFTENTYECELKFREFLSFDKETLLVKIVKDRYLPVTIPGCLISKKLYEELGGFEKGYLLFEDLLFFYKIVFNNDSFKIGFTPNVTYYWRDFSGVSAVTLGKPDLKSIKKRIILIEDNIRFYQYFLTDSYTKFNHDLISHCRLTIEELKFKKSYLEARIAGTNFVSIVSVIVSHRRVLLRKLTIKRIIRYIQNQVSA